MILKTCFLLMLSVAWEVSSASFSNVFMQYGPEIAPRVVEYPYDVSAYTYVNPQIGQLALAPVEVEYSPIPSFPRGGIQCATNDCFYPEQLIAEVNPVATNSFIEYIPQVSKAPLVYSPVQNGRANYEYAYVVVNEGTGDQKAHSELSDVGVVRGRYSFLQPDGNIREVTYVADDTKGFNAIVKNFLPVEEIKHTETGHITIPCHEVKSEPLTAILSHIEQNNPIEEHEAHKDDQEAEQKIEEGNDEGPAKILPEGQKMLTESLDEHKEDHETKADPQDGEQHEIIQSSHGEEKKIKVEQTHENLEVPTHEKIIEIHRTVAQEADKHEGHQHNAAESNVFVSYNDIIKCIQAAMAKGNNGASVPRPTSPLTYLVLNKPCYS